MVEVPEKGPRTGVHTKAASWKKINHGKFGYHLFNPNCLESHAFGRWWGVPVCPKRLRLYDFVCIVVVYARRSYLCSDTWMWIHVHFPDSETWGQIPIYIYTVTIYNYRLPKFYTYFSIQWDVNRLFLCRMAMCVCVWVCMHYIYIMHMCCDPKYFNTWYTHTYIHTYIYIYCIYILYILYIYIYYIYYIYIYYIYILYIYIIYIYIYYIYIYSTYSTRLRPDWCHLAAIKKEGFGRPLVLVPQVPSVRPSGPPWPKGHNPGTSWLQACSCRPKFGMWIPSGYVKIAIENGHL